MTLHEGPTQAVLERSARVLGEMLAERGWRVATAESCTGGWIAQAITAIAGSSDWFDGGLVTYSNQAKIELLDVAPMLLERHGAVSAEVAAAMAEGALCKLGADLACAVTGVAGPGGGSAAKPVGTVWFGFARAGGATRTLMHRFPGDRRAVRAQTVVVALEELAAQAG